MIVPSPNIEITKTPMGLNLIPNKTDTKYTILGKKDINIKKIPISIQKNPYMGSKLFFLTNNVIKEIIITPIKKAINLECKDSIFLIF